MARIIAVETHVLNITNLEFVWIILSLPTGITVVSLLDGSPLEILITVSVNQFGKIGETIGLSGKHFVQAWFRCGWVAFRDPYHGKCTIPNREK